MANPEPDEGFKKLNIEREESKQVDIAKNKDRRLLSKKSESSKMTPKKKSGKKQDFQVLSISCRWEFLLEPM